MEGEIRMYKDEVNWDEEHGNKEENSSICVEERKI